MVTLITSHSNSRNHKNPGYNLNKNCHVSWFWEHHVQKEAENFANFMQQQKQLRLFLKKEKNVDLANIVKAFGNEQSKQKS